MADFFTSPQEKASQDLFAQAQSGRSPYDMMIENERQLALNTGKTLIGQQTSQAQAGIAGDTLSQAASAGVGYGSGVADLVGKQSAKVGESGQIAMGKLTADVNSQASQQKLQALMDTLHLGLGGLSKSSSFGDILAGLETFANIGTGVLTGGASAGLWGSKQNF